MQDHARITAHLDNLIASSVAKNRGFKSIIGIFLFDFRSIREGESPYSSKITVSWNQSSSAKV
jgi:hypothetical protein